MANDDSPDATRSHPAATPGDGSGDALANSIRPLEGWTTTLFAEFRGAEPSSIRATPDGDLFVAIRDTAAPDSKPGRARVLKLKGTNWGGKANEIHEFVPSLNSPGGLEWDGEWLYVMDSPGLIAVRDRDGDEVADENRTLVTGFSPGQRGGVTLGIDGWLYLAIGGSGFARARGTDGTAVQLPGGGVIRVRPDGSELHVFSRGAGAISEVAVSPTLDIFGPGGSDEDIGWKARVHHFTGLDRHGFPALFRGFAEDVFPSPTPGDKRADAGSARFLAEPDLPGGNGNGHRVLLTADPSRNLIVRRTFEPAGATWRETARLPFAAAPQPAALDVDAEGRVYLAGSKEGTGFVAVLTPPDSGTESAPPRPALASLPTADLIRDLRKNAPNRSSIQRAMLRRNLSDSDRDALEKLAGDSGARLESRIAALFTMKRGFGSLANETIAGLARDPELSPFALRALGDFPDQQTNLQASLFGAALDSDDAPTRREAILAISRLKLIEFVPKLARLGGSDDDPVLAHLAVNALTDLGETDRYFEILDDKNHYLLWPGLFRSLARIHEMPVVEGLISRLEETDSALFRSGALKTLARLYHREREGDEESAGLHPNARGPCLDPVTWEGSAPIDAVLRKALRDRRVNKTFILTEISRNRIPYTDFDTLLSLTAVTPELEAPAVDLILDQQEPPRDSLPFLTFIATSEERPGDLRLRAGIALARSSDDMAALTAFQVGQERDRIEGIPQLRNRLRDTLINNSFQGRRYDRWLEEAHGPEETAGVLAWTMLLQLTRSANVTSTARREIKAAIVRADSNPAILRRMLLAISDLGSSPDEKIVTGALDHPDPSVSEASRKAAAALNLGPQPSKSESPRETGNLER